MADHCGDFISGDDFNWATQQYEQYLEGAREVVSEFIRKETEGTDTLRVKRVLDFIRSKGETTVREIYRKFHFSKKTVQSILMTLKEGGVIGMKTQRPEKNRGSDTTIVWVERR